MGMRHYDFEDWLAERPWWFWPLLLVGLSATFWLATTLGWIETPPPEGWHPKT